MSSLFGISYLYHLRVSASHIKYSPQVFLPATPLWLINFSTPNHYSIRNSFAQVTLYRYSFQLFLSLIPSYFYQLLLSATHIWQSLLLRTVRATPYCITYSYYPVISAAVFRSCFQLTTSHTPVSHSHQLFILAAFTS